MQLIEPLPNHPWITASNVFVVALAFGALLYYFVRAPFLVDSIDRIGRRWQQLQDHRRELDRWSQSRRAAAQASRLDDVKVPPDDRQP